MGGSMSRIAGMLRPAGAVNLQKLAETQALRNALRNYINAYKALPMNQRERQNIQKLLNTAGVNNITYKNRIATAIAGIVKASKVANTLATTVVANGAPEAAAVAAVNNAAAKIKNLNNFIAGFKGGNKNALAQYYTNSGRNYMANRGINEKRNGGAKYKSLWNNLASRSAVAAFTELPGTNLMTLGQALRNAKGLPANANTAAINKVLNNLRRLKNNASTNNMRKEVQKQIDNLESRSLLTPTAIAMFPNTMPLNAMLGVPHNSLNLEKRKNLVVALMKKKSRANISPENKAKINAKVAAIRGEIKPTTAIYKALKTMLTNAAPGNVVNKNTRAQRAFKIMKNTYQGKYLNRTGTEAEWNAAFNSLMKNINYKNKPNHKNLLKRIYFAYKKQPLVESYTNRDPIAVNLSNVNTWNAFKAKYPK